VLIGINLLREGLDLPEVSLVAILDADKEGYLRSATSLIQTIGRCARHVEGRAILYADHMTDSMRQAIGETNRRRAKQQAYNLENNITPQSIRTLVDMELAKIVDADYLTVPVGELELEEINNPRDLKRVIDEMELAMRAAAGKFEFERAAGLRDRIRALKLRDPQALYAPAPENPETSEGSGADAAIVPGATPGPAAAAPGERKQAAK
jgi:excinuclease ABC subunit B